MMGLSFLLGCLDDLELKIAYFFYLSKKCVKIFENEVDFSVSLQSVTILIQPSFVFIVS